MKNEGRFDETAQQTMRELRGEGNKSTFLKKEGLRATDNDFIHPMTKRSGAQDTPWHQTIPVVRVLESSLKASSCRILFKLELTQF